MLHVTHLIMWVWKSRPTRSSATKMASVGSTPLAVVLQLLVLGVFVRSDIAITGETSRGNLPREFLSQRTYYDPCYEQVFISNPNDFVNAAYGKQVTISSACGAAAIPCFATGDSAQQQQQGSSASYLTDLHNIHNATCWESEAPPPQITHNLTLTLSLGKRYELTFISLIFCHNRKPESFAIYKSMDFGRHWHPFQYFSTQCRKMYGKPHRAVITRANEQEALCTNAHWHSDSRVSFSIMEGRPSAYEFEHSPVLQDWVSATDIQIVFNRASLPNDAGLQPAYSAADLAIGGRCKCNGHASKCVNNKNGQLVCDCRHNTEGADCDRCKTFYFDRPWGRATASAANECKPCECNLHARQCRFNMELFKMSGSLTGGVCLKCRHNTAGKNCHLCREGSYRDSTKPMNHKKACRDCGCHPVGSLSRVCNQVTGQCVCKEGLTGLTCNRCARGYQQTRSTINPCIKMTTLASVSNSTALESPSKKPGDNCKPCLINARRLNLQSFCKRDYAILAAPVSKEVINGWLKFKLSIQAVFKKPGRTNFRHGRTLLRIPISDYVCHCPRLKLNRSYLILGTAADQVGASTLVLHSKSIVIEWRQDWTQRLRRLEQRASRKCS